MTIVFRSRGRISCRQQIIAATGGRVFSDRRSRWFPLLCIAAISVLWFAAPSAQARVWYGNPTNYISLLKRLHAGDRLLLGPGIYRHTLPIHGLRGTRVAPIEIEGPKKAPVAVIFARRGVNTISIANASYITIRNLEVDGRGLGMDGVKAEGNARYADHITLDSLYIHNLGGGLQTVGVSTKCAAWGWLVRRNVIVDAGTGMYFGNSDGKVPFLDSVIEYNVVRDTLGYNLQIKHQPSRLPDLRGFPRTRTDNIIRYNTFSKAHNAESDPRARPNVLVGHGPLRGVGRNDATLVYGNLFYQNPVEALFQGEGNIALYNNVFVNRYRSGSPAIAIQPHHAVPRTIMVFHNTVISPGAGIAIVGASAQHAQWVWANAVFAGRTVRGGRDEANITAGYHDANKSLRAPFAPSTRADFRPKGRRLKCDTSPPFATNRFPDAQRDYFGDVRRTSVCGAIAGGYAGDNQHVGVAVDPRR